MAKKPDFTLLFAKYCLHTNKLAPKELSLDELPNLYQRRTKYKSEDELWRINLSDILRGLHDGCFGVEEQSGSLARGQKTNNMAALVALLTNKSRRALDMAVYQRRIFSDRENNLMTFMLPFSLVNLTQDRNVCFPFHFCFYFQGSRCFTGGHLKIGISGKI